MVIIMDIFDLIVYVVDNSYYVLGVCVVDDSYYVQVFVLLMVVIVFDILCY